MHRWNFRAASREGASSLVRKQWPLHRLRQRPGDRIWRIPRCRAGFRGTTLWLAKLFRELRGVAQFCVRESPRSNSGQPQESALTAGRSAGSERIRQRECLRRHPLYSQRRSGRRECRDLSIPGHCRKQDRKGTAHQQRGSRQHHRCPQKTHNPEQCERSANVRISSEIEMAHSAMPGSERNAVRAMANSIQA
jgi:hypothetical protein